MNDVLDLIARNAKSLLAGVGALATYLAGLLAGSEGLDTITTQEWLIAVVVVLPVWGITWAIPNKSR